MIEPLWFISAETRPSWHENDDQEDGHGQDNVNGVFKALLVPADSQANDLEKHIRVNHGSDIANVNLQLRSSEGH